jgi:molybdate transport system substrate-binding protein
MIADIRMVNRASRCENLRNCASFAADPSTLFGGAATIPPYNRLVPSWVRRSRIALGRSCIPVVLCLLLQAQTRPVEIVVLTSGTFTAAHLELAGEFERSTMTKVTTATTSMGVGAESIPDRLQRGDPADVVIVAAEALDDLIRNGRVRTGSRVDLGRSRIGMAVRAGAPRPDISSLAALTRTLLNAQSVAISSSVSGDYFTEELFPRLGIAEQMAPKTRRSGGERVGTLITRGEAEIGFQQMSELLPITGIDIVGPLPSEVQRVTVFAAGIAAQSTHPDVARAYIRFLASKDAARAVARTGLEPATGR